MAEVRVLRRKCSDLLTPKSGPAALVSDFPDLAWERSALVHRRKFYAMETSTGTVNVRHYVRRLSA